MSHIKSKLEISKHRNYSLYSLFMHKHRYLEISFSGHQNAENEQTSTEMTIPFKSGLDITARLV